MADARAQGNSWIVARFLFLRVLCVSYFAAFLSVRGQILGLIGSHGISPALNRLQPYAGHSFSGFFHVPTLLWFDTSDAALLHLCDAGAVLAALLAAGVAPGISTVALWALYLSIVSAGGVAFENPCDTILLETGFFAMFLGPAGWRTRSAPGRIQVFLMQFLLFRFMLTAGLSKVVGDPSWRNLTALDYQFETQPLPTALAWYAAGLPAFIKHAAAGGTLALELLIPFAIFGPRNWRRRSFAPLVIFQITLLFMGNYAWFNVVTIGLCLFLLDDAVWGKLPLLAGRLDAKALPQNRRPTAVSIGAAALVVCLGLAQTANQITGRSARLPLRSVLDAIAPFRALGQYPIFDVIWKERREIVIEGSLDGANWRPYDYRWKTGRVDRPPPFFPMHHPRLDSQLTWRAYQPLEASPWVSALVERLLAAEPSVVSLFLRDPFPDSKPWQVRAALYRYRFTSASERRATGDWWSREFVGFLIPPTTIAELQQRRREGVGISRSHEQAN